MVKLDSFKKTRFARVLRRHRIIFNQTITFFVYNIWAYVNAFTARKNAYTNKINIDIIKSWSHIEFHQ